MTTLTTTQPITAGACSPTEPDTPAGRLERLRRLRAEREAGITHPITVPPGAAALIVKLVREWQANSGEANDARRAG